MAPEPSHVKLLRRGRDTSRRKSGPGPEDAAGPDAPLQLTQPGGRPGCAAGSHAQNTSKWLTSRGRGGRVPALCSAANPALTRDTSSGWGGGAAPQSRQHQMPRPCSQRLLPPSTRDRESDAWIPIRPRTCGRISQPRGRCFHKDKDRGGTCSAASWECGETRPPQTLTA